MEERLRKFARLVDAGSFTQASKELHLSQPALSAAISKLERELRSQLLIRGSRSFRLTEAGKLAYTTGKALIIEKGNLLSQISELAQEQAPITIGMIDSIAGIMTTAESLDALDRQAKVSLVVNNSRYLIEAVERDELDVAFVVDQTKAQSDLIETSFVGSEALLLVCHTDLVQTTQKTLEHGLLPNFISYDPASTSYQIIDAALQTIGVKVSPTFTSTSPAVMLSLVLAQKGTAVLPYLLVKDLLQKGTLTLPKYPKPIIIERRITIIKRRRRHLSSTALDKITTQVRTILYRSPEIL